MRIGKNCCAHHPTYFCDPGTGQAYGKTPGDPSWAGVTLFVQTFVEPHSKMALRVHAHVAEIKPTKKREIMMQAASPLASLSLLFGSAQTHAKRGSADGRQPLTSPAKLLSAPGAPEKVQRGAPMLPKSNRHGWDDLGTPKVQFSLTYRPLPGMTGDTSNTPLARLPMVGFASPKQAKKRMFLRPTVGPGEA